MILTHHGINSLPRGDESTVRIGEHDYPVVRIGAQMWTAENLYENCPMSSWYNDDETTARANKYGKLYRFGDFDGTDPFKYVRSLLESLPLGWRLPSQNDWRTLYSFLYNNYSHGDTSNYLLVGHDNRFGFDGVLCGYRNKDGDYVQAGETFPAWSSTYALDSTGKWLYNGIMKPNTDINTSVYSRNNSACAIRLVKDA